MTTRIEPPHARDINWGWSYVLETDARTRLPSDGYQLGLYVALDQLYAAAQEEQRYRATIRHYRAEVRRWRAAAERWEWAYKQLHAQRVRSERRTDRRTTTRRVGRTTASARREMSSY